MNSNNLRSLILLFLLAMFFLSCQQTNNEVEFLNDSDITYSIDVWSLESGDTLTITATPFMPAESLETGITHMQIANDQTQNGTETLTPNTSDLLLTEAYIPEKLIEAITGIETIRAVESSSKSMAILGFGENCSLQTTWIYAVVVPFPTVMDEIGFVELQQLWFEGKLGDKDDTRLLLNKETELLLEQAWGQGSEKALTVVESAGLADYAWQNGDSITIIPFEELQPKWKVLKVDGISPLDHHFSHVDYSLTFTFCIQGMSEDLAGMIVLPETNRDQEKFTSVILTGVTALVRATAHKMEVNGILYPAEQIDDLLWNADFTHVSNEVAFADDCPYPNPYQSDLRFCSDPDYLELLTYLDIDIVELTGNHIQDWSRQAFIDTLGMYDRAGIEYYAGGFNAAEAGEPLLIEHHGNKIAFLGCNAVGPPSAWASDSLSGNLPCGDYEWLIDDVKNLVTQGYLPIVTLQHNEFYSLVKTGPQMRDFNPLAEAGAVIVSGSQAHYPNPFGFVGNHLIHYGLGNLFFDQMDAFVADGIQREFVDRHIFYDGQYISTEIYTLHLEDFAQPRLMTSEEREAFLNEAFAASGWR